MIKETALLEYKYQCPECGWVGTESEMGADYISGPEGEEFTGESWSNWICPSCNIWYEDLEDYIELRIPKKENQK